MFTRIKFLGAVMVLFLVVIYSPIHAGMEPGTFKPEGKGYFYYHHDFSNPSKGGGNGRDNSFDFSRMYFGGKYQLSEVFMIRYLTDIAHEDKTGKFGAFTKYAYVDWKIEKAHAHILLGLQSTNNWSMPEKAWGYRVIRKSPMESFGDYWGGIKSTYEDLLQAWADTLQGEGKTSEANEVLAQKSNFHTGANTKMGSSADMGVGAKFKFRKAYYLNFMVRNGVGYKLAENDVYKNAQLRFGGYFLEKALHLSAYTEIEPWHGVESGGKGKLYMNYQWDFMASYEKKDVFLLGVNINGKTIPGDLNNVNARCYSGFGSAYLVKGKLKALARYDFYETGFNNAKLQAGAAKPKTNASLIIAGLDYVAHKNVHIIPNVQILDYEDGDFGELRQFYVHAEFKF